MNYLMPRPVRDYVNIGNKIINYTEKSKLEDTPEKRVKEIDTVSVNTQYSSWYKDRMILLLSRTIVAAFTAFAFYLSANPAPLFVAAVVSFPATAIALGSAMLVKGVIMMINTVASNSLELFSKAFVIAAGGYFVLEFHDVESLGLMELGFAKYIVNEAAYPVGKREWHVYNWGREKSGHFFI